MLLSAAVLRLVVNYFVIYDFCGSAVDVVHPSNPRHLIVRFELFSHALTLSHLFYKLKKAYIPPACLCQLGIRLT